MSTHGGKREGAGRKPRLGERLVRVTVTLTRAQVERLKALGKGNASEGVRTLLGNDSGPRHAGQEDNEDG